jgi:hypothetical protein
VRNERIVQAGTRLTGKMASIRSSG